MKKKALPLLLMIAVTLLVSSFVSAYYISANELENSLSVPPSSDAPQSSANSPTASPAPTSISSQTPAPLPTSSNLTPTTSPSPLPDTYIEGVGSWLPVGVFGVKSPKNQTYNTNVLWLSVSGTFMACSPSVSYSLDGGPQIPFALELKPLGTSTRPSFQVSITGSVALPPLSNGSHVIVVYGDLASKKGKITVFFEIQSI